MELKIVEVELKRKMTRRKINPNIEIFQQLYKNSKPKCKRLKPKRINKVSKNKSPIQKFRDKVWSRWSKYIRLRDNGVCFTCGVKHDTKECNAGHYKHGKLDFDEININCQCVHCNKWLNGNLGEYGVHLIDKYGREKYDDLILRANQHKNRYSIKELETIYEETQKKIDKLNGYKPTKLPF